MEMKGQKPIQIFLSYASQDKHTAGDLKSELERFRLKVFVAHEDIRVSDEWREVILEKLVACDVFIPILSSSFPKSEWTDQETGIAFFLKKLIIPLRIGDTVPYGFIDKYQAGPLGAGDTISTCAVIIEAIGRREEFREPIKDGVIEAFCTSGSYKDAESKSILLLEFSDVCTESDLNRIFKTSSTNSQIYNSWVARDNLKILISQYVDKINPELLEEFYDRTEIPKSERHLVAGARAGSGTVELSLAKVTERWPEILKAVKKEKISTYALLLEAEPVQLEANYLTLGFKEHASFHRNEMEKFTNLSVLQRALQQTMRTELDVFFVTT